MPYAAITESAFALSYLRKGIDIIPDSISGFGYADDVAIINVVFETYKQPFSGPRYCPQASGGIFVSVIRVRVIQLAGSALQKMVEKVWVWS
jgi:uncharacterized membrane protein YkvA (DUF1232 family)